VAAAIKFACPHCDRVCKVPAELAGKQGRCPGCRKGLEVPLETPDHLLSGRQDAAKSASDEARISKRVGKEASDAAAIPTDEREDWDETETQALCCPACKLDVEAGAYECPYCHYQLRKEVRGGLHWATPISLLLVVPLPLLGMVFARIALVKARERQSFETAAWVSVFANGINLLIGLTWMLNRLVR
jgi:uncharacterized paraquat-inducible protein A